MRWTGCRGALSALFVGLVGDALGQVGLPVADVERREAISFQADILPVLRESCLACHNQTRSKGDLILESPQAMRRGGVSGPALVDGMPEESLVFLAAAHREEGLEMPPPGNASAAKDLTPGALGLLRQWILQGAPGSAVEIAEPEWEPLPESFRPIYSVAMDRQGRFAAAGRGNQVWLYEAPTRRMVARLTDPRWFDSGLYTRPGVAQRDLVSSLAFSPDGRWLATGDYRAVRLWRRETPLQREQWDASASAPIAVIAPGPEGALAWASANGGVFWRLSDSEGVVEGGRFGEAVHALHWSPEGDGLLALGANGALCLFDASAGIGRYENLDAQATVAAWLGAREWGYVTEAGAFVSVALEGESIAVEERALPQNGARSIVGLLSEGDSGALMVADDGSGWRWRRGAADVEEAFRCGRSVAGVAWLARGERLLMTETTGASSIWDLASQSWVGSVDPAAPWARDQARWDRESRFLAKEAERARLTMDTTADERVEALSRWGVAAAALRQAEAAWETGRETLSAAESAFMEAQRRRDTLTAEKDRLTAALEAAWERQKILEEEREVYPQWAQSEEGRARIAASVAALTEVSLERGVLERELEAAQAAWNQVKGSIEKDLADLEKGREEAQGVAEESARAFRVANEEFRLATRAKERLDREVESTQEAFENILRREGQLAATIARATPLEIRRAMAHGLGSAQCVEGGAYMVAPLSPQELGLFSAETGEFLEAVHFEEAVTAWSIGTAETLWVGLEHGVLERWDVAPRWAWAHDLDAQEGAAPFEDRITALAFSPDGRRLAVGGGAPSRTGALTIFGTSNWRALVHDPSAHSDVALALAFSATGDYLASGGADRFVRVWRARDLATERAFEGHSGYVYSLGWAGDDRRLVSAAADGRAMIWDREVGARSASFEISGKEGVYAGFRGEGQRVLAVGSAPSTREFTLDGKARIRYEGARDYLSAGAQDAWGRRFVAGGYAGTLWLWEGDKEYPVATFSVD